MRKLRHREVVRGKFQANKLIKKTSKKVYHSTKDLSKNKNNSVSSAATVSKKSRRINNIKKNESLLSKRLFDSRTLEFLKRERLRRYYLILAERRHKNWFNIILNRNRSSKRKLSVFFKFFCAGTNSGSIYFYKLFKSRFFSSYNNSRNVSVSNLKSITNNYFNYNFFFNNYFTNKARCIFFNNTKDFYFSDLSKYFLSSRYFFSSFAYSLFKKKF